MSNLNTKTQKISVGLDIGTTKVCAIILTEDETEGKYKIIGCASAVNAGVNRGVIVNIEKTVEAIKTVIHETEQQSGITISEVVANSNP